MYNCDLCNKDCQSKAMHHIKVEAEHKDDMWYLIKRVLICDECFAEIMKSFRKRKNENV